MMRKIGIVISLCLFAAGSSLFLVPRVCGEIVGLKGGQVIEGTIVDENEDFVTLEVGGGKVKIPKSNVKTVWRGTKEALIERKGKAIHLVEGVKLYEGGKLKEALDEFSKAEQLDVADPIVHANLGSAYASIGDRQKAKDEYLKALEQDPKNPTVHINLANLYVAEGNYKKAIEHYETAKTLAPANHSFDNNLAYSYFSQGEYSKALKIYETSNRSDDMVNMNNRAAALIQLGEIDRAEKILNDVIAKKYFLTKAHLNMAELYKQKKDKKRAIQEYEIALAQSPKDRGIRLAFAEYNLELGQTLNAREELEKVLKEAPDDVNALYLLALVDSEREEFEAAVKQYEKILKIDPKHLPSRNNMAFLFIKMNQPKKAVEQYSELFSIDDTYAKGHVNAGLAYAILGDVKNAEKEWNRALELNPDLEEAKKNKSLLDEIMKGNPADGTKVTQVKK